MYNTCIAIYKSQELHGLYDIIQSCSRHVINKAIRGDTILSIEFCIKAEDYWIDFIETMNYKYNK